MIGVTQGCPALLVFRDQEVYQAPPARPASRERMGTEAGLDPVVDLDHAGQQATQVLMVREDHQDLMADLALQARMETEAPGGHRASLESLESQAHKDSLERGALLETLDRLDLLANQATMVSEDLLVRLEKLAQEALQETLVSRENQAHQDQLVSQALMALLGSEALLVTEAPLVRLAPLGSQAGMVRLGSLVCRALEEHPVLMDSLEK